MTIEQRLERLEQQNRVLRIGLIAGLAGLILLAVLALTALAVGRPHADEVVAERFVLTDRAGTSRAELAVFENGPAIRFTDSMNRLRAQLGVRESLVGDTPMVSSGIAVYDEGEQMRIGMHLFEAFQHKPPQPAQKVFAAPTLLFKDANGNDLVTLTARGSDDISGRGAKFTLVNSDGHEVELSQ